MFPLSLLFMRGGRLDFVFTKLAVRLRNTVLARRYPASIFWGVPGGWGSLDAKMPSKKNANGKM